MIIPNREDIESIKKAIGTKDLDEHTIGIALAEIFGNQYFRLDYIDQGFISSVCMEHKPWDIITQIVDLLGSDRYNYNDLDCDLYGFTGTGNQRCLCKIFKEYNIYDKDYQCLCTDGVAVDFYKHYFLIHSNHGNSMLYHVIKDENAFYYSIDIRRLKYNQSKEKLTELGDCLVASIKEDRVYHELLNYNDSRDIGFSLSFKCPVTYDGVSNIDVSQYSGYDVNYITEHLLEVLKDMKK